MSATDWTIQQPPPPLPNVSILPTPDPLPVAAEGPLAEVAKLNHDPGHHEDGVEAKAEEPSPDQCDHSAPTGFHGYDDGHHGQEGGKIKAEVPAPSQEVVGAGVGGGDGADGLPAAVAPGEEEAAAAALLIGPPEGSAPPPAKKAKKERKEFTAHEKLQILAELEGPNAPSVFSILEKYGVSKSSLHRWRQPDKHERLQEMAAGSATSDNFVDTSKKRDMSDRLGKVKLALRAFCEENLACAEDVRLAITSGLIQFKARQIKDELLKRHETAPDLLTDEEVVALKAFKASKSWACLVGNQLGYLTAATVTWTDVERENTERHLEQHCHRSSKPKKQRMEFTAQEKLAILRIFEETQARPKEEGGKPPPTIDEFCKQHHTSKSSFHRWKHQAERLRTLALDGSGRGAAKRVCVDRLSPIKAALRDFVEANAAAPPGVRVPLNYSALQARALAAREEVLARHRAAEARRAANGGGASAKVKVEGDAVNGGAVIGVKNEGTPPAAGQGENAPEQCENALPVEAVKPELEAPSDEGLQVKGGHVVKGADGSRHDGDGPSGDDDGGALSQENVLTLTNFKASNSWLREMARKFNWKLDGAVGSYPPPDSHPQMEHATAAAAFPEPPRAGHPGAHNPVATPLMGNGNNIELKGSFQGDHERLEKPQDPTHAAALGLPPMECHGAHDPALAPVLAEDGHHRDCTHVEGHLETNDKQPQYHHPEARQVVFAPAAYDAEVTAKVEVLEEPPLQAESNNTIVDI